MIKLKSNKSGFTLVEIIIVIVIVAILAAITVPTMLGFVEKANQQQYVAEARAVLAAAEVVFLEKYVNDANVSNLDKEEILEYLGDEELSNDESISINVMIRKSKIYLLTYARGSYIVQINVVDKTVKVT